MNIYFDWYLMGNLIHFFLMRMNRKIFDALRRNYYLKSKDNIILERDAKEMLESFGDSSMEWSHNGTLLYDAYHSFMV